MSAAVLAVVKALAFRCLGTLVALTVAGLGPAAARSLTQAESASLIKTVADFETAMQSKDFEAVVEAMPPRVLAHIANNAGVGTDALHKAMAKQIASVMAAATIESYGMDTAGAEQRELSDGTPYVLIPTEVTVVHDAATRMTSRFHTLAFMDERVWYLVQLGDLVELAILRQVYPEYSGVEFPLGLRER